MKTRLMLNNNYTALAVCFVFSIWAIFSTYNGKPYIYEENQLIEIIQICILALTIFSFFLQSFHQRKSTKLIYLFFSLLCYSFILREVDVEHLDIPEIFKFLGSGLGRNISITILFIAIFINAISYSSSCHKKALFNFFKQKTMITLGIAVIFLLTGDFFEKQTNIIHNVFYEEMFELYSYTLIFYASFIPTKKLS